MKAPVPASLFKFRTSPVAASERKQDQNNEKQIKKYTV